MYSEYVLNGTYMFPVFLRLLVLTFNMHMHSNFLHMYVLSMYYNCTGALSTATNWTMHTTVITTMHTRSSKLD